MVYSFRLEPGCFIVPVADELEGLYTIHFRVSSYFFIDNHFFSYRIDRKENMK